MASDKAWYWAVRYEEIAARPQYDILLAMRDAQATNSWSGYAGRGADNERAYPIDASARQVFFYFWSDRNPHTTRWDFEVLGLARDDRVTEEKMQQRYGRERQVLRDATGHATA
jgi:hypothetical protein